MKISSYILLSLALATGTALRAQITYQIGDNAAIDMLFNMPTHSLASSNAAAQMAARAGAGVLNNYGYVATGQPPKIRGTNLTGRIDMSLVVNVNGSYTGTISGQAGTPIAQISGSMASTVGANATGTFNLFFSWETLSDMEGKIYVEYKIGIGDEVRTGHLETDLTTESLVHVSGGAVPAPFSPAEAAAAAANGGRFIYKRTYKYFNITPMSIWLLSGYAGAGVRNVSVILWPIEYPGW